MPISHQACDKVDHLVHKYPLEIIFQCFGHDFDYLVLRYNNYLDKMYNHRSNNIWSSYRDTQQRLVNKQQSISSLRSILFRHNDEYFPDLHQIYAILCILTVAVLLLRDHWLSIFRYLILCHLMVRYAFWLRHCFLLNLWYST